MGYRRWLRREHRWHRFNGVPNLKNSRKAQRKLNMACRLGWEIWLNQVIRTADRRWGL